MRTKALSCGSPSAPNGAASARGAYAATSSPPPARPATRRKRRRSIAVGAVMGYSSPLRLRADPAALVGAPDAIAAARCTAERIRL